jgi:hypothetical protein
MLQFQAPGATGAPVQKLEAQGTVVITGKKAKEILPHDWSNLGHPQGGVVDPTAACWDDAKRRSWGALAKLAGVEHARLEDPHNGKLRPVVQVAAVRKALADKGVKLDTATRDDSGMVAYRAKQKATEERDRLETEARRLTWIALRAKVGRLEAKELALIAGAYWEEIWHENQKRVLDAWSWPQGASDKAIAERIQKLPPAQLARFLVDLAIVREIPCKSYNANAPTRLVALGRRHGVSLDKIRAGVKKEAQLKKAAKAAAAKKKARTAPGKVKIKKPAAAKGKKK